MANVQNNNVSAVNNAAEVTVEGPTIPNYHEEALARLEELRNMRGLIPKFKVPATPIETSRLTSAASVPPDFIELAAVMALGNPDAVTPVQAASATGMRDLLAYAAAYAPLAEELEALAKFVRHSVIAARNRAGVEALAIYAGAKRLVKQPEYARLAPHIAGMRRVLGKVPSSDARARRAAKKLAPQAAVDPQTA